MAALDRIYERTGTPIPAAGLRAESRWLLGLIGAHTHAATIRAEMRRYSDERIGELLTELEALELVRSKPAGEEHDLDFTGSLSLSALRAAHNARP
jgi:hypothetical protein